MRFIAFADTHTSLFRHRKIVQHAKNHKVDFLVCVGDFTLYCNYWKESLDELAKAQIKMIFIPGNHEYQPRIIEEIEKYPFVVNIHQKVYTFNKIIFMGLGAQDYPHEKNHIKDVALRKKAKWQISIAKYPSVLLSHVPPKNTQTAKNLQRDGGSKRTYQWVCDIQPSLVLCGHIHRPAARIDKIYTSSIYNVACQCHLFEMSSSSVYWLKELSLDK
ncbi:metallophosphoesterase family protein [Candidatus Uabimicrobium amorphum]|uniref:3',5'-cyclic adenosine monophosphatephosphodiesterase CpdA n=2 Tax=Uabimicrobium amorphum TaxID=2596890 RepID=A0A5S9F3R9_UABAM|nr:3',5'-cyclic adenosine monophosphatephosphodiesterase CpdA [Candidatus Uabimicrobium amorphum]